MWTCGDEDIRALWSLDPQVAFLNHGSYGAVPNKVSARSRDIQIAIEKNPVAFLSRELSEALMVVRLRAAQWLTADPEGLAFVANTTSGIGAVLSSLDFSPGDEIVFHDHGYGWVRQGLANLSSQKGVVVREAEIPSLPQNNQQIIAAFEKEITKKTRLIITDHVTSPTGLVFPVTDIVRLARAANVPVLIDGAHAPGFLPLDLAAVGADFYVGNFHKWCCAPRGSAFLYVQSQWRDKIRPQALSYQGGLTHGRFDHSFTGYFDWNGTDHFVSWLSVPAALQFHEELGWSRVFAERRSFLFWARDTFHDALCTSDDESPRDDFLAAMMIVPWRVKKEVHLDTMVARALTAELYEHWRVEVPVIFFKDCLYLRISAQIYNRPADVMRLVDAVRAHRFSAVRVGEG